MVRNSAFRTRVRVILLVMVAVVASMTLHHGAMASAPTAQNHAEARIAHPVEDAGCTVDCGTRPHSMPACCGIGLCLSGLPVAPSSELLAARKSVARVFHRGLIPKSLKSRIDRPPKGSARDEV